jgi:hypothetical protein
VSTDETANEVVGHGRREERWRGMLGVDLEVLHDIAQMVANADAMGLRGDICCLTSPTE